MAKNRRGKKKNHSNNNGNESTAAVTKQSSSSSPPTDFSNFELLAKAAKQADEKQDKPKEPQEKPMEETDGEAQEPSSATENNGDKKNRPQQQRYHRQHHHRHGRQHRQRQNTCRHGWDCEWYPNCHFGHPEREQGQGQEGQREGQGQEEQRETNKKHPKQSQPHDKTKAKTMAKKASPVGKGDNDEVKTANTTQHSSNDKNGRGNEESNGISNPQPDSDSALKGPSNKNKNKGKKNRRKSQQQNNNNNKNKNNTKASIPYKEGVKEKTEIAAMTGLPGALASPNNSKKATIRSTAAATATQTPPSNKGGHHRTVISQSDMPFACTWEEEQLETMTTGLLTSHNNQNGSNNDNNDKDKKKSHATSHNKVRATTDSPTSITVTSTTSADGGMDNGQQQQQEGEEVSLPTFLPPGDPSSPLPAFYHQNQCTPTPGKGLLEQNKLAVPAAWTKEKCSNHLESRYKTVFKHHDQDETAPIPGVAAVVEQQQQQQQQQHGRTDNSSSTPDLQQEPTPPEREGFHFDRQDDTTPSSSTEGNIWCEWLPSSLFDHGASVPPGGTTPGGTNATTRLGDKTIPAQEPSGGNNDNCADSAPTQSKRKGQAGRGRARHNDGNQGMVEKPEAESPNCPDSAKENKKAGIKEDGSNIDNKSLEMELSDRQQSQPKEFKHSGQQQGEVTKQTFDDTSKIDDPKPVGNSTGQDGGTKTKGEMKATPLKDPSAVKPKPNASQDSSVTSEARDAPNSTTSAAATPKDGMNKDSTEPAEPEETEEEKKKRWREEVRMEKERAAAKTKSKKQKRRERLSQQKELECARRKDVWATELELEQALVPCIVQLVAQEFVRCHAGELPTRDDLLANNQAVKDLITEKARACFRDLFSDSLHSRVIVRGHPRDDLNDRVGLIHFFDDSKKAYLVGLEKKKGKEGLHFVDILPDHLEAHGSQPNKKKTKTLSEPEHVVKIHNLMPGKDLSLALTKSLILECQSSSCINDFLDKFSVRRNVNDAQAKQQEEKAREREEEELRRSKEKLRIEREEWSKAKDEAMENAKKTKNQKKKEQMKAEEQARLKARRAEKLRICGARLGVYRMEGEDDDSFWARIVMADEKEMKRRQREYFFRQRGLSEEEFFGFFAREVPRNDGEDDEDYFERIMGHTLSGGQKELDEAAAMLGVNRHEASKDEINRAFRRLSLKLHPDKYRPDQDGPTKEEMEQQFKKLSESRDLLLKSHDEEGEAEDEDDEEEGEGFYYEYHFS